MNSEPSVWLSSLTEDEITELDVFIKIFEDAWPTLESNTQGIDRFIPNTVDGDLRFAVAMELAIVDIERRIQSNRIVDLDSYLYFLTPNTNTLCSVTPIVELHKAHFNVLNNQRSKGIAPKDYLQSVPAYVSQELQDVLLPPNRYLLERKIGQGALGTVYWAWDREVDRHVAVKRFHSNTISPHHVYREVEIMSKMNHPGILPIYGLFEQDGCLGYAMGIVGNPLAEDVPADSSLEEWLTRPRTLADTICKFHSTYAKPWKHHDQAVQLLGRFEAICETVEYAHSERKVIHRDLKPQNIMIARHKQTFVVDWGNAELLYESRETGDPSNGLLGTPGYMSPELANNHNAHLTSDIYSLGAILYEILSGEPPIIETSTHSVRGKAPTPVVARHIPSALKYVCKKAMELRPEDRYQSARDLGRDVGRWLANERVSGHKERPLESIPRAYRKNPRLSLAVVLIFSLLLGFAYTFYTASVESDRATVEAIEREAVANLQLANSHFEQSRVIEAWFHLNKVPKELRKLEWNLCSRKYLGSFVTLYGHQRSVKQLLFDKSGSRLLSHGGVDELILWDRFTGTHIGRFPTPWEKTLNWNEDATQLLCDPKLSSQVAGIHSNLYEAGVVSATTINSNGHVVIVGLSYLELRVDGKEAWRRKFTHPLNSACCPLGRRMAVVSFDSVSLIDLSTGTTIANQKFDVRGLGKLLAFGPDGQLLATAHKSTVKLWDANSLQRIGELTGHKGEIVSLAFSPDNELLATGSRDNLVRVWDLGTHQLKFTFVGHAGSVECVAFSPDCKILASGSNDTTVKFWDVRTGQQCRLIPNAHSRTVSQIHFSSDGNQLATIGGDQNVRIWNPFTETEDRTLSKHPGRPTCIDWGPDNKTLAVGTSAGDVVIYDSSNSEPTGLLDGHKSRISSVSCSPTGDLIATGSLEEETYSTDFDTPDLAPMLMYSGPYQAFKLWDPVTAKEKPSLERDFSPISSLAFNSTGTQLSVLSRGHNVLLNPVEGKEIGTLADMPVASTFSRLSNQLLVHGRNWWTIWDTDQTDLVAVAGATVNQGEIEDVTFADKDRRVISVGDALRIWDAQSGDELVTLTFGKSCKDIDDSPASKILGVAVGDSIALLDTVAHEERTIIHGNRGMLGPAVLNTDGTRVAVADRQGVRVWNVEGGELALEFDAVNATVAFGARGKYIAARTGESIQVWDVSKRKKTFEHVGKISRHGWELSELSSLLATADKNGGINIWDAANGQLIRQLSACVPSAIESLEFDSSESSVLATTSAGDVVLLALDSGRLIFSKNIGWKANMAEFGVNDDLIYLSSYAKKRAVVDGNTGNLLRKVPFKPTRRYQEHCAGGVFATSVGRDVWLVDRAYSSLPRERKFRKLKSAGRSSWHEKQVGSAIKRQNWFSAAYHLAWLRKIEPNNAVWNSAAITDKLGETQFALPSHLRNALGLGDE